MYAIKPSVALTSQYLRPLLLMLLVSTGTAFAGPAGTLDVTVASVQGDVSVTVQARRLDVHKGDVVPLPATIYTGPSGSIELRQGKTTLSLAPNSQLVIPASTVPGEPIDRVIQTRGNAFYNVAKRETRKLHVESAYLVAVVKGTQFSVVAQDDSATISLFEGRLEVRATDDSDVVDLQAGEIAIRHAADSAIRMLRMDTGEPVAHRAAVRSAPAVASTAGPVPAGFSNASAGGGDSGNLDQTSSESSAGSAGSGSTNVNREASASLGSGSEAGPAVIGSLGSGPAGAANGAGSSLNGGLTTVSSGVVAASLGSGSAGADGGSDAVGAVSSRGKSSQASSGGSPNSNGSAGAGAGGNGNSGNANNGAAKNAGSGGNPNSNGSANAGAGGNGNSGNGGAGSNNAGSGGNPNGNGSAGAAAGGNGNSGNAGNGAAKNAGSGGNPNGNGSAGAGVSVSGSTLSSAALSSPVTHTHAVGINLGTGGSSRGAANANPAGGLLRNVTPLKGSPSHP